MTLASKVALVTGASMGLGLAICSRFIDDGASVAMVARGKEALTAAANELTKRAGADGQKRVYYMPADVSRIDDVEMVVESVTSRFGALDILVSNAGVYGPMGPLDAIDWKRWVEAIEINLLGTAICCRAVAPVMRRRGSGKIITLSGGGATQALPYFSAYAASKAAVVRLTETLAEELRGSGIDVNAVAPGALNTRLLDQVVDAGADLVGSEAYARALRQKEEGGASLEGAAELVSFLASPASNGITGRLLSAVWDDWRTLPRVKHELAESDVFTLRRIVPTDRGWQEP